MKNRAKVLPPLRELCKLIPGLLFLLSVLISLVTTYYVTGHYIDSDASSELVLAKHLAETGQILSQDWIYSTELRVLNTQLVYAPLFLIFSDWHMVRFVGAILLQAIMILSYAFLIHETGLSKRVFYISAALLLLPVSVAYGRIVLYHCYYIPHIALSFVLLGLTMRFTKEIDWKKPKTWLSLFLLVLFSFIGGLGGIRQLMITHAPMLLSIFTICFLENASESDEYNCVSIFTPTRLQLIICALLATLFSYIGMKVNTDILSKYYIFQNQSEKVLGLMDASEIEEMLYGFFHQFGFRKMVPMLSLTGILSLGGLFVGIYCLIISVKKIRQIKIDKDIRVTILQSFFLFYTAIMMVVFILTTNTSNVYLYPQYLTFCLSWSAPLLVLDWHGIPKSISLLNTKKIFSWLAIFILLLNGLANVAFFNGGRQFNQLYEGLPNNEMNTKEKLEDVITYLSESGYRIGYSTFWDGNVITEITNGKVRMINIALDSKNGNIWYYDWLTSQHLREAQADKPFILIFHSAKEAFELSDSFQFCTIAYEDENYCVYDITDINSFIPLLYS